MTTYKVISNRQLSTDTYVLRAERPSTSITAGQCFSVGTAGLAINREYSMYSAADDDYVDFLIRRVEDGRVSTALSFLKSNDDVEIGGPYGEFCLKVDHLNEGRKHVFIGSGTGIAPFHSFYMTYPELDFEILHGVRFENEQYDADVYPEGKYASYVSRPTSGSGRYVTAGLENRELKPDEVYYLCGNRNMIVSCISLLREKGIHGDSIFTETFF